MHIRQVYWLTTSFYAFKKTPENALIAFPSSVTTPYSVAVISTHRIQLRGQLQLIAQNRKSILRTEFPINRYGENITLEPKNAQRL